MQNPGQISLQINIRGHDALKYAAAKD